MDKFLTLTVLLLLVLAVASNPLESKRKTKCKNGGTVGSSTGCANNTSFFKRIYDAYKRGEVEDAETPDTRDWDLDLAESNYQKKSNDFDNEEEKLRILTEILAALEDDSDDLK